MITALIGTLSLVVGWMVTHLPLSPFANLTLGDITVGTYTIRQILAWVNWLIPFHAMTVMFGTWLAAILVVWAVMWAKGLTVKVGTNGVLGGE